MYKLKITFKTINTKNNLQKNLKFLKTIGKFNQINIKGFYKKKNKNKIFTLLKSPHIYKKTREHFIYKNFINKININFNTFLELLNFIILLKKTLNKNKIINIKILKNAYNLKG